MKLNSFFYQNVHSVIVKKINISQKQERVGLLSMIYYIPILGKILI